jgi:PAS domain S-box-containing protein
MANAIPQLAWIANADGWIHWYNLRWYDYTGTTPEQMAGWGWQSVHDPVELPQVLERWQASIATGEPFDMTFPLRGADGVFRPFLTRGFPLKAAGGRVVQWFGTNTDVTEIKRAETLMAQLNQDLSHRTSELEAANKELEAFAYSVSHDLRAPLRGIDGWTHALAEDYGDKLDATGREFLAQVCAEAQRMGQLIDDLLELSRVTRSEMRREPVDLSALAGEVVAKLRQYEPQRQIEIAIAPDLTAMGDSRLLRQVFENLFGNAWKFTGKKPGAKIEFGKAANYQPSTINSQPAFFIRDNGAGFDMAYSKKLFAPFQRLHRMNEFPGTGIGLATVQRIIHRHGGQVRAEAVREQGATFYFTLPTNGNGGARP